MKKQTNHHPNRRINNTHTNILSVNLLTMLERNTAVGAYELKKAFLSLLFLSLRSEAFSPVGSHQRLHFIPGPPFSISRKLSSTTSFSRQFSTSLGQHLTQTEDGTLTSCPSFGGSIYSLDLNSKDDGFLTAVSVPTFAVKSNGNNQFNSEVPKDTPFPIKRLGLEGIVPGSFILQNVLNKDSCEEIISCCDNELQFEQFKAGKNHHGAMQIVVTDDTVHKLSSLICPFIDLEIVNQMASEMKGNDCESSMEEYAPLGLNRRWRIYKYQPGGEEAFAPHIDAGFPPSILSKDGLSLIWDATSLDDSSNDIIISSTYPKDTVSRLTVLIYLNDDFQGGQTKFYAPVTASSAPEVIASVTPKAGSILLFPQAVGEDAVEHARKHWPLHEGSPVTSSPSNSRAKYVIRSDILFTKVRQGITEEELNDPLWKNDDFVRQTFLPSSLVSSSPSRALDSLFLKHCQELYNPHMGVENAGPLLYSLVRFTKLRKVVEIGAGYTTLFLLQALKDNDIEMKRVKQLQDEDKCRLLDIEWTIPDIVDNYNDNGGKGESDAREEISSLLCIDNCLHQRETATGAGAVAKSLGLDSYLQFVKGDAFDMQFEPESIDLLWCDFGVGSRMKDFAISAWKAIKPGGFLVCHSTLTNTRTRSWLEKIRNRCSEEETGIPDGEFVEISLLEPHKRYQNSVTILQRRKGSIEFEEPIYSEYA
jgi:predicted O-methyltransferase YrrM